MFDGVSNGLSEKEFGYGWNDFAVFLLNQGWDLNLWVERFVIFDKINILRFFRDSETFSGF